MDKNLQQFRYADLGLPVRNWGLLFLGLTFCVVLGATFTFDMDDQFYAFVFFAAPCAVLGFGLLVTQAVKNTFVLHVPAPQFEDAFCFLMFTPSGELEMAPSRKYASRKIGRRLIYLFNGMRMSHTFVDEEGIERTIRYIVYFRSSLLLVGNQFYQWYVELLRLMSAPNLDDIMDHLASASLASKKHSFEIEFPRNPPPPAPGK